MLPLIKFEAFERPTEIYYRNQNYKKERKKFRIRETKNLLTDVDSRTDKMLERLQDLSFKKKI